jgi:hypothetical protein
MTDATVRPPRLAIVGTGAAAAIHADAAAAAGVPVTALVGRGRRSGAGLADATGAPLVGLGDLPGRADAVLVATDPASHEELARRVLDLGLPVLVERPLAGSTAAAAALADRGALAAENLRHAPLVRAVLDRGLPPVDVEVRVRRPRPGWGAWPRTDPDTALLVDLVASGVALALDALGLDPAAPAATAFGDAVLLATRTAEGGVGVDLRAGGRRARIAAAWTAVPLVDLQVAGDGFVSRAELLPDPGLELDGEPVAVADAEPLVALGYVGQLTTALPALGHGPAGAPAPERRGEQIVALLTAIAAGLRTGAVVTPADLDPRTPLLAARR